MELIHSLDYTSLIIGAVLGAILGAVFSTWHSHWVRQPKVELSGGGGGGGANGRTSNLTIWNRPGLLGVNMGPTIMFGNRISRGGEYGLVVDRHPAERCSARLIDAASDQQVAQLAWNDPNGQSYEKTIASGESGSLAIFCQHPSQPGKYYPWFDDGNGSPIPAPTANTPLFDDTREFLVEVSYSYGRKRKRFRYKITKDFSGRFSYRYWGSRRTGGGGSF